jgi:hypothetical protein
MQLGRSDLTGAALSSCITSDGLALWLLGAWPAAPWPPCVALNRTCWGLALPRIQRSNSWKRKRRPRQSLASIWVVGQKFNIVHLLHERGIPFIFRTGYDPEFIPNDLAGITRLQKPVELRHVIGSIAAALNI